MKNETTISRWDRLHITVRITRIARLRLWVGVLLIKLAVVVIGCGVQIIDTDEKEP